MTATTLPNPMTVDEDLCELIAHYVAAHRPEPGTTPGDPVDDDVQARDAMMALLRMARPDLDGDEAAAIQRLKAALLAEEGRS